VHTSGRISSDVEIIKEDGQDNIKMDVVMMYAEIFDDISGFLRDYYNPCVAWEVTEFPKKNQKVSVKYIDSTELEDCDVVHAVFPNIGTAVSMEYE
jgi:hypothetical protein